MMEYFSTKSESCGGQNNPDPSEGPWGRWSIPPHGGALSSPQARHRADHRSDHEMHEGRGQTGHRSAYAGSRLKLSDVVERSRLKRQPFSRTGENPQSGSASSKNWCVQQETSLPGQKSGAP